MTIKKHICVVTQQACYDFIACESGGHIRYQQQPLFPLDAFFLELIRLTLPICSAVGSAPGVYCCGSYLPWPKAGPPGVPPRPPPGLDIIFSLISLVIVSKASSTLCVAFALVSKKGMPN